MRRLQRLLAEVERREAESGAWLVEGPAALRTRLTDGTVMERVLGPKERVARGTTTCRRTRIVRGGEPSCIAQTVVDARGGEAIEDVAIVRCDAEGAVFESSAEGEWRRLREAPSPD